MLQELNSQTGAIGDLIAAIMWFMPRTMVFIGFIPLFSKNYSSTMSRIAIASALSFVPAQFYFHIAGHVFNQPGILVLTAFSEACLGLFMGLTLSLPYHALMTLGALADVYRGATFAAMSSPVQSEEVLPAQELMGYFYMILFVSGPMLILSITALYQSFIVMPPGMIHSDSLSQWGDGLIRLFANFFSLALLLSAPLLIVTMLSELAMSVISAFAPNLQVYSLQYALRSLIVIAVLYLVLEYASDEMIRSFNIQLQWLNKSLAGV
ncbi:flagellar biosynthetic protein FliR [Limnobacter humi]|uniref:Flagellar biosynthetic protein FliR n=1 Tax=Limnobacter humi TaxID=1778671 RepID=A0ABT1WDF1_9BURK|nr:flagellar biosynthetic protein FliR [Limnobacter humi]MCQ8895548.1 flagellar biosynthetic protein FliR [Limnobacter humi]